MLRSIRLEAVHDFLGNFDDKAHLHPCEFEKGTEEYKIAVENFLCAEIFP